MTTERLDPYVIGRNEQNGRVEYSVWRNGWVKEVSQRPMTHDEAVVLCERLNREARDPRELLVTPDVRCRYIAFLNREVGPDAARAFKVDYPTDDQVRGGVANAIRDAIESTPHARLALTDQVALQAADAALRSLGKDLAE